MRTILNVILVLPYIASAFLQSLQSLLSFVPFFLVYFLFSFPLPSAFTDFFLFCSISFSLFAFVSCSENRNAKRAFDPASQYSGKTPRMSENLVLSYIKIRVTHIICRVQIDNLISRNTVPSTKARHYWLHSAAET